jgi:hypothetical protein
MKGRLLFRWEASLTIRFALLLALSVEVAIAQGQRGTILIPGVQEPEEMRVEPFPTKRVDPTGPERMLAEAL